MKPWIKLQLAAFFVAVILATLMTWYVYGPGYHQKFPALVDSILAHAFLPAYLIGLGLGDNPHRPSFPGFLVGVTLEVYFLWIVLYVVVRMSRRKTEKSNVV